MCGAVLGKTARAIPARKICSPRLTPRATIRWRWSRTHSPRCGVMLHLEIGNAVPESTCTDNTSTTPPQLCEFPGQPGVVGWKNSLEISKVWPRNFASCAAGGDCTARFPYGQKDSYHYVLFGHSLAIPAWNTPLSDLHVDRGLRRHRRPSSPPTAAPGSINYCPSRITISGVLGNPSLNGVYNTSSCPDCADTLLWPLPASPTGPIPTAHCRNRSSA